MRTSIVVAATLVGIAAADAQTSMYYAERGHWTVASGSKYCRALNRPMAEFNSAPYNALQIAVDGKGAIAVEVFFWPGAVMSDRAYKLRLDFPTRKDPIVLDAKPNMGDLMLASVPDPALWRAIQDASSVDIRVYGEQVLNVYFSLDDAMWVLNALTACRRALPQE